MAAEPITVDNLPNPDEDPESWNVLWTSGLPVPGQYVSASADGDRERDVEHRKSKGSSRDVLQDQGLKPTEITVTIRTTSGLALRELQSFYRQHMDPERPLNRRTIASIAHPQIYALGVKQVYWYARQLPKPSKDGGDYPLLHVFKARIVGPKTQITAREKSSKPKQPTQVGGPTDPAFRATGGVTTIQPTSNQGPQILSSSAPARPADQPVQIYTPAEIDKLSGAGQSGAQFASKVLQSRTPR